MEIHNLKINKNAKNILKKSTSVLTIVALSCTLAACGNKKTTKNREYAESNIEYKNYSDNKSEQNLNKTEQHKDYSENIKKLKEKYYYVSSPVVRNNKSYVKVRNEKDPAYGFVSLDTLEEVIPVGTYDYISNEIKINDKSYFWVSTKDDDGYANGLMSLDDFSLEIPCKTYRVIKQKNTESINYLECLNTDRETIDTYMPDENLVLRKCK